MRAPRGYSCPFLLGREAMASLLAACRKNLPAAYGLHSRAKPVRLSAASLARLICTLWQNNPPLFMSEFVSTNPETSHARRARPANLSLANTHKPLSRLTPNHQVYLPSTRRVKKPRGYGYRAGKSD